MTRFLPDVTVLIVLVDPAPAKHASAHMRFAAHGQHGQVTDSDLLARAVAHGGTLVSLDRRLVPDAVRGGRDALVLI